MHYKRWQRHGDPSVNLHDFRVINSNGYIQIRDKNHPCCGEDGYVMEHRLIMERHLARYLKPEEIIHHTNGNRTDNRLENLILLPNNCAHVKMHIKAMLEHQGRYKKRRAAEKGL